MNEIERESKKVLGRSFKVVYHYKGIELNQRIISRVEDSCKRLEAGEKLDLTELLD
ncbi:hypothetical protein HYW76_03415 [Candidatus Pacearchaeota archaeon]|nr:hypothetical protein [Candidatus Pacearchaeota archaeon]